MLDKRFKSKEQKEEDICLRSNLLCLNRVVFIRAQIMLTQAKQTLLWRK